MLVEAIKVFGWLQLTLGLSIVLSALGVGIYAPGFARSEFAVFVFPIMFVAIILCVAGIAFLEIFDKYKKIDEPENESKKALKLGVAIVVVVIILVMLVLAGSLMA